MTLKQRLEQLGHWFFYAALRLGGHRAGLALLAPVIAAYVSSSPKIRRTVRPYLEHRFPGKSGWRYFRDTYRYLYGFGHVLVDRGWLGIDGTAGFDGEFVGYRQLEEVLRRGRGAVLVTAHVGNWQAALAYLGRLPVPVHAVMQYDRQAPAKHYFDLEQGTRAFSIIDAEGPFGGLVEAAAALQRGEAVTMMGDRYIRGSCSQVEFLGEPVRLPDAPYLLAATTGAPVVVLLAAKTGRTTYQLKLWDQFEPVISNREERGERLVLYTRRFAAALERYLRRYPFQWYNFYDFWNQ